MLKVLFTNPVYGGHLNSIVANLLFKELLAGDPSFFINTVFEVDANFGYYIFHNELLCWSINNFKGDAKQVCSWGKHAWA
jgi:hypothetical protein